jgi:hypothetical protein
MGFRSRGLVGNVGDVGNLASDQTSGGANVPRRLSDCEREWGPSTAEWEYVDATGVGVGKIIRWDLSDGKKVLPFVPDGGDWVCRGMPTPRPLYQLPTLAGAKRV